MSEQRGWVDRVRVGYDAASFAYRADEVEGDLYRSWTDQLCKLLPSPSRVVDLGCGCGIPVARDLAAAGHEVIGVDISDVQIERARASVPDATFETCDLADAAFERGQFDAAVLLYSIIHVPLEQQRVLISRVASWLRPEGVLLMTAGFVAWTGSEDRWLGSTATMWWSQADAPSYRAWLQFAGFIIDHEATVPDGHSAHSLFWAHTPAA